MVSNSLPSYLTWKGLQSYVHFYWPICVSWFTANRKISAGLIFWLFMIILGNYAIFAARGSDIPTVIRLPVLLRNAEGIEKGAQVSVRGVHIGHVESLTYVDLNDKEEVIPFDKVNSKNSYGQGVIIILSIDRKLTFYPNYRVISKRSTILAGKKIEILTGNSPAEGWEEPKVGQQFPWRGEIDWGKKVSVLELDYWEAQAIRSEAIISKKAHLVRVSNYDDPLYLFASVMHENKDNFFHGLQNVHDITHKINTGMGTIGKLLNRPEIDDKLNNLLKEFIYFTGEARDGLESLRESDSAVRFLFVAFTLATWSIGR